MQATAKSPQDTRLSTRLSKFAPRVPSTALDIFRLASEHPFGGRNSKTTFSGGHMNRLVSISVIVICLLAMLPTVSGQSVTGQISGTVADSAGAVIPGAVVQLTNDLSKQTHTFTTDSNGSFVFANLVPGSYSI